MFSQPSFSSDWDRKRPVDNEMYSFNMRISEPCGTESEASAKAWNNLLNEEKNPESFKVIMQEVFDSLL